MTINHRVGSYVFGIAVGLAIAVVAYQWVTDPEPGLERERQEQVVIASRAVLAATLKLRNPEIVDPLATNRRVGKVYVYRTDNGWEVSGYYRRDDKDRWHPYLMTLNNTLLMRSIKVRDKTASVGQLATDDPRIESLP